jgi:hypothetical protein
MTFAIGLNDRRSTWRRSSQRAVVCNELVHVTRSNASGLPTGFQWRGRHYRIAAVGRSAKKCAVPTSARGVAVRTTSGMQCVLEHRVESDVWVMGRILPGR